MTSNRRAISILITLALLPLPNPLAAQVLDRHGATAAEVGLAGAGVNSVQSPASLWTNPANLVHSKSRLHVALGIYYTSRIISRILEDVNPELSESRDGAGVQLTPSVGFGMPLWKDWLWAGLGYSLGLQVHSYYPPIWHSEKKDSKSNRWRVDPGRYTGTEMELSQHVFSLGCAFLWRWLAVGFSLELTHVTLKHRRSLWAGLIQDRDDMLNDEQDLDVDALIKGKNGVHAEALFGLWLAPHPRIEIGFAIRLPTSSHLDGEVILVPGSKVPRGYKEYTESEVSGSARMKVPFPLSLRGGISLDLDVIRLFSEAKLSRWSDSGEAIATLQGVALTLKQNDKKHSFPISTLPLGIDLQDLISIHLGLEVPFWSRFLVLRAGYAFCRGGTRDAKPSATMIDLDRHILALGIQVAMKPIMLALSFSRSIGIKTVAQGEDAFLVNPLDPTITDIVGKGRYSSDHTRVVFELQVDSFY